MASAPERDRSRLALARRALAEASDALGVPAPVHRPPARVPTGLDALDRALDGGLARGRIVELSGGRSSGRMSLALRLLEQAVATGEPAALVDVPDALDPRDLSPAARERLLWVRPGDLLAGLKSADVVLDAGGFAMVALYLVGLARGATTRVPASAWTRLAQRAERAGAVLLVVTDGHPACSPGAFAAVALAARRRRAVWTGPRLLDAVEGEVAVVRNRMGAAGATAAVTRAGSGEDA